MLQNNLGIAYRNQGRIDEAIAVLESALDFCSLEKLPNEWVMTQNNLGNAYHSRSRIEGEKLQDLDLAIANLAGYQKPSDRTPQLLVSLLLPITRRYIPTQQSR